ncbi:MAG: GatB/YqeY domain-containing protein [Chloroflexota bacterium]
MSLRDKLQADAQDAMRQREAGKARLSVLRLARAAVQNSEIEKQRQLTDDEVLAVLAKEAKDRREAIEELKRLGGREDRVEVLESEIKILSEYLPKQMSEDEIHQVAAQVIAEVGATSAKDIGKVMGPLMARTRGKADGKLVNEIVRSMLK